MKKRTLKTALERPVFLYGEAGGKAAAHWDWSPCPTAQTGCNLAVWNASHLPEPWMEDGFRANNIRLIVMITDDPDSASFTEKVNAIKDKDYVEWFGWKDEPNLYHSSPPSMSYAAARKFRQLTNKKTMLVVAHMRNEAWDERDYLGVSGATNEDDAFDITLIDYYKSITTPNCSWRATTEEYISHLKRMANRYDDLGFSTSGRKPRYLGVIQGALNNPLCQGEFSALSYKIMRDQTNEAMSVHPAYCVFGAYAWEHTELSGASVGLIDAPQNREIVKQWAEELRRSESPLSIGVSTSKARPFLSPESATLMAGSNMTISLLGDDAVFKVVSSDENVASIVSFDDRSVNIHVNSGGKCNIAVFTLNGAALYAKITAEENSMAIIDVGGKRQVLWDYPGTYFIGHAPTNVTRIVNKPTKNGAAFQPSTWELWKNSNQSPNMIGPGGSVVIDPDTGVAICLYTVQQPSPPAPPWRFASYAASSDLSSWDKTIFGSIFFGGTYQNNVLLAGEGAGNIFVNTRPGALPGEKYILIRCTWDDGIWVSKSADGKTWATWVKVASYTADGSATGGWDSSIGKYVFYIRGWIQPASIDRRCVVRIEVDPADLFGTWPSPPLWNKWGTQYAPTPDGAASNLSIPSATRDVYGGNATKYPDDGMWIANPDIFDHPLNHVWGGFAFSRNYGEEWTWIDNDPLVSSPFIPNGGTPGIMDTGSIYSMGFVRFGIKDYFFYSGSSAVHDGEVWNDTGRVLSASMIQGREAGYKFPNTLEDLQIWRSGPETNHNGIVFNGKYLVINAKVEAGGKLGVHFTNDTNTGMMNGFGPNDIKYVEGPADGISIVMKWNSGSDVSALSGLPVRMMIRAQSAEVYGFQFLESIDEINISGSCDTAISQADRVFYPGETKTIALTGIALSAPPKIQDALNNVFSVEGWTQGSMTIKATGSKSGFATLDLVLSDGSKCAVLLFLLPSQQEVGCF